MAIAGLLCCHMTLLAAVEFRIIIAAVAVLLCVVVLSCDFGTVPAVVEFCIIIAAVAIFMENLCSAAECSRIQTKLKVIYVLCVQGNSASANIPTFSPVRNK